MTKTHNTRKTSTSPCLLGIVAVVSCLFGLESAQASCGDYVKIGNPRHASMMPNLMPTLESVEMALQAPQPLRQPLCNGPNCGGVPYQSAPLPTVPSTVTVKDLIASVVDDFTPRTESTPLTTQTSAIPLFRLERVYRPPQS